jgi:cation diffusion facilitator family transporter
VSTEAAHRQVEQRLDRDRERTRLISQRTALMSIGVRATLAVMKYILATLSGSMSLLADAVNNISDVAQSFTLWIGLRISGRKTKTFPYGLYKLENLISLGIVVLISLVGYELARRAILGGGPAEIAHLPWTIAATVAAMAISFGFSRYEARLAAQTGSPALEADSRDSFVDGLASLAVLVSLVSAWLGYNIDVFTTLVIVAFIVYTAAGLAVDSIRVLLDASLEHDLLNLIQQTIERDPDVLEVHSLMGRNSGPYRFVEAHVVLDVHDLDHAHQVSYRLEEAVHEVAPNVDRVLIHFEPKRRETYVYALPLADSDGDTLSEKFGEAARYVLVSVGIEDRTVRETHYLTNPYADEPGGRGIRVAQMLAKEGANAVFTREEIEGKGPYYVLSAAHIEVLRTGAQTLPDALAGEQIHMEVPADGTRSA